MAWFLDNSGALPITGWIAGAAWILRHPGPKGPRTVAALAVVTVLVTLGMGRLVFGSPQAPLAILFDYSGVAASVQWVAVAALLLITVPWVRAPVGVASLVPLLLNGWSGGGGLFVGVLVAATGAAERSQPGRWALLGALVLFPAAGWLMEGSLAAWSELVRWGVGRNLASLIVDLVEHTIRLLAWLVLFFAVIARLKGRGRGGSPSRVPVGGRGPVAG